MNSEIIAIYTETGFMLDAETTSDKQPYANAEFLSGCAIRPYTALLYFGFEDKSPLMTQSLAFLHSLAAYFIEILSRAPDMEITCSAPPLSEDDRGALLHNTPYAIGVEFITETWLEGIWGKLIEAYESELSAFDGSAAQFLLTHNSNINVAGRVFFHLVENK